MARVRFSDGTVINFNGTPTPQDIEEAYASTKGITPPTRPSQSSLSFPQALGLGLRETGVAALHGFNAAFGGIPRALYERQVAPNPRLEALGYTPAQEPRRFPEPTTPEGKALTAFDVGVGAIAGLPGRAFTGATRVLANIPKIPEFLQRAGAGTAGGLAFNIAQPETYWQNVALGAVGNVVLPPTINRIAQGFRRKPLTVERLLKTPEANVQKLPPSIRDLYIRERRRQLAQSVQIERGTLSTTLKSTRNELQRLDRETLSNLAEETTRLEKQLRDKAYQIALKLKQTDIGPVLKQQQTRYADLVRSAIGRSGDVPPIPPKVIIQAIEKRFENNPRAFNLAYDQLQLGVLDKFGHPTEVFFSPQELLNEIDRLGLTVPRSPTQTYTFADDVADELRDVLLDVIEQTGASRNIDLSAIRAAKAGWRAWKPVQKRLIKGTRYFEESETVTDAFVQKLTQYARTDRTPNSEKYFGEIARYIGKDFAKPLEPIVTRMDAIQRQRVALEAAKLADAERLTIQGQLERNRIARMLESGKTNITNLEISLAERAERAKKMTKIIAYVAGTISAGGLFEAGRRLIPK